jgi:hypothetical protein
MSKHHDNPLKTVLSLRFSFWQFCDKSASFGQVRSSHRVPCSTVVFMNEYAVYNGKLATTNGPQHWSPGFTGDLLTGGPDLLLYNFLQQREEKEKNSKGW